MDAAVTHALGDRAWLASTALAELCAGFEALGQAGQVGPFLAHLEARMLLDAAGIDAARLARGGHLALAASQPWLPAAADDLRLVRAEAGLRIAGACLFTPFARTASRLLVAAPIEGTEAIGLVHVDPGVRGLHSAPLATLDLEPLFELRFEGVLAPPEACLSWDVLAALETSWARATVLACAELAGIARAALTRAAEHARTREQFGRPIGAFQAVSHRCADMALGVEAAELAVQEATARIDAGEPAAPHASRAKVICSEVARRVTTSAHQVMGGEGYLARAGLHHGTRRAKALESRLGPPSWHRERIAVALSL